MQLVNEHCGFFMKFFYVATAQKTFIIVKICETHDILWIHAGHQVDKGKIKRC